MALFSPTWADRLATIAAGLQDAGAGYNGQQGQALALLAKIKRQKQLEDAQKAYSSEFANALQPALPKPVTPTSTFQDLNQPRQVPTVQNLLPLISRAPEGSDPSFLLNVAKAVQPQQPEIGEFDPTKDVVDKRTGNIIRKGAAKPPNLMDLVIMGPDGKPRVNPLAVDARAQIAAAGRAPERPRAPTTAGGLQYNTDTGQWEKIPGYLQNQIDVAGGTAKARTDAANEAAAIDLSDPSDRSYIESVANYKVRPPSAGRNPVHRRAVIEAALKVNPDYTEAKFDQSTKALRDFGTGKQGDVARSLNVSVAHLETLKELGRALNNGDITLINAAKQRFSEEFGVPAPTNFDTAKSIVADEVAKGVIGGQSAQSDRETLAASLRRSGSFPVIEGAINTFQSLLGGQLSGLRSQYERTTGAKDFDTAFLSEATRNALEGNAPSGQGGSMPAPRSAAERDALPPGTTYRAPDGSIRVR